MRDGRRSGQGGPSGRTRPCSARTLVHCALLALTGALAGCGYTFQGSGSVLPPDVRKVYIPLADNNTTEPGLGQRLTEALRSRFERYGIVEVVEREAEADAVLRAKIVDIDSKISGVTRDTDVAVESFLYMTVAAELKKRNGQVLYRNTGLTAYEPVAGVGETVVTTSSTFAQGAVSASTIQALGDQGAREVARSQEDQALDELLDEISRKLYLDAVAADF